MKAVFLDLDGPLVQGGETSDPCVTRLQALCLGYEARLVIISDHRYRIADDLGLVENREEVEKMIGPKLVPHLHAKWCVDIGIPRDIGIERWVDLHKPERFVILDDQEDLYSGASNPIRKRLVLCTNRHGLTVELMWQAAHLIE